MFHVRLSDVMVLQERSVLLDTNSVYTVNVIKLPGCVQNFPFQLTSLCWLMTTKKNWCVSILEEEQALKLTPRHFSRCRSLEFTITLGAQPMDSVYS